MKQKIGIMMIFFGIACGDSPNLLIPALIIALGAWMYFSAEKKKSPAGERRAR